MDDVKGSVGVERDGSVIFWYWFVVNQSITTIINGRTDSHSLFVNDHNTD